VEVDDPLFPFSKGNPKALIEMGGKALVQWVAEAMVDAESVDHIAIVGIKKSQLPPLSQPIDFLPDLGDLVSNGYSGMEWSQEIGSDTAATLFCTGDLPTVTGAFVDEHIAICQPFDKAAYYAFVTKESMETRFPEAVRTYTRLDGVDAASCDIVLLRPELAAGNKELFNSFTRVRKHPWKTAKLVGARTLVELLLGRMSIEKIEETAQRILGQQVHVFFSERAELAMDVDKPSHLELLRSEFE
jgi:hypothetical protein